jgi:ribonucleoside-triphosphate reductase
MYKTIKKRDGRLVDFDVDRITKAIAKAGRATREFNADEAKKLSTKAIKQAEKDIKGHIPTVEQIQNAVENTLMSSNYHKTAKAYILYREERNRIRDSKSRLMTTYQTIAQAMSH